MTSIRSRPNLVPFAGVAAAVMVLVLVVAGSDPTIDVTEPFSGRFVTGQDARSYYGLDLADLYEGRTNWNTIGAYPYSPAFAQLVYPLNLLPWPMFVAAWTILLLAAVFFLTGPRLLLLGLVLGAMEIAGGNISLLLTVAIVAGFRYPWTWAFVILTKITPGIGLLWFVLRREWRQLGIALGATAAIVAVLLPADAGGLGGLDRTPRGEHRQGRHLGGRAGSARDPRPDRRRAADLGRAAQPALGGADRRDARAAGPLVRVAVDGAGRDPADDARGAQPGLGAPQIGHAGPHPRATQGSVGIVSPT